MKQDDKAESILEAATKRFSHFGVDKTTMNEIADDLGISKASLYYYFPDKLNLYAAVLKKIIDREHEADIPFIDEKDLLEGMHKYLEKRTDFIIRNYRILEYLRNMAGIIPEELRTLFNKAKDRDLKVIEAFIRKGKEQKILNVPDPNRTAGLIHDCLLGLRMAMLKAKVPFFSGEIQFTELLSREKELIDVFFNAFSRPGS